MLHEPRDIVPQGMISDFLAQKGDQSLWVECKRHDTAPEIQNSWKIRDRIKVKKQFQLLGGHVTLFLPQSCSDKTLSNLFITIKNLKYEFFDNVFAWVYEEIRGKWNVFSDVLLDQDGKKCIHIAINSSSLSGTTYFQFLTHFEKYGAFYNDSDALIAIKVDNPGILPTKIAAHCSVEGAHDCKTDHRMAKSAEIANRKFRNSAKYIKLPALVSYHFEPWDHVNKQFALDTAFEAIFRSGRFGAISAITIMIDSSPKYLIENPFAEIRIPHPEQLGFEVIKPDERGAFSLT